MKQHLFFLLLLSAFKIFAQVPEQYPFRAGEKLEYTVYYNLSWIWVNAADVSFSVSDSSYRQKEALFFLSCGSSNSSYDWIFEVRDTFCSFTNVENITPLTFSRNTKEGSSKTNNYYLFDLEHQNIYSFLKNSDSQLHLDTLPYNKPIRDVLSSTYYFRTIDFSKHSQGDTISVNTIMDNEIIPINAIYLGIEEIRHKNEKLYTCYKFKTRAVKGTIFDSDSEIIIWISRDENKIPIKIKAEILVGSVVAYLRTVEKPKIKSKLLEDFYK